jgi:hypothetical protein
VKLLEGVESALVNVNNNIGKSLNISSKKLQMKFKHACDFGITGNFNKINAARFGVAINNHVNSPMVKSIKGTYRGQPVIHFIDPNIGLNTIFTLSGEFISGWKLKLPQLQNVLKRGSL